MKAGKAAEIYAQVKLCEQFHVLPEPGGLMDQDPLFIRWALVIREAEAKREALDRARGGS